MCRDDGCAEMTVTSVIFCCCFVVYWFSDRLKHPNIVQLLETYEDKSKVYLVMEL